MLSEIFDSRKIQAGQKKLQRDFNKVINAVIALKLPALTEQRVIDDLRSEYVNKNTEMVLGAKVAADEIKDAEFEQGVKSTDAPE